MILNSKKKKCKLLIAIISGISIQFNWLSYFTISNQVSVLEIVSRIIFGPILVWLLIVAIDYLLGSLVKNLNEIDNDKFQMLYGRGYSLFLFTAMGMFGIELSSSITIIFVLFCFWIIWSLYKSAYLSSRKKFFSSMEWLVILFFFSGFSALIYQIVWQRMLFTFFGVNIESVTIIVIIFMLGLGVGAIVGGFVSKIFRVYLPLIFVIIECGIGVFGAFSGMMIDWIKIQTIYYSQWSTIFTIYTFLFFPTLCMGMTLPILVEYLEGHLKNVGKSVGTLYSINTLGSALACFITVDIFFTYFGQTISLWIAASLNLAVGFLVYIFIKSIAEKRS